MAEKKKLTSHLYFWVLIAIVAGGIFGAIDPDRAVKLKPLGDGFIALVKMLIAPVIFCTVVLGIAGAGDMKKVGRVGGKALIYFETVSNVSLLIGLVVVNVLKPGEGFNVDPATLDTGAVADYAKAATQQSTPSKAPWISSCASFRELSSTRSPVPETCCRSC
jgi:aerobic C4-dicarboxylate transport protein